MNFEKLNRQILSAHAAGDGTRLAGLYGDAGARMIAGGEIDSGCFFLTQAYVHALENGLTCAEELHRQLAAHGRER